MYFNSLETAAHSLHLLYLLRCLVRELFEKVLKCLSEARAWL